MHPAVKQFVEVLAEDVKKWETAADNVDKLMPRILPGDREAWAETAKGCRRNAAEYKALIEQAKEGDGA